MDLSNALSAAEGQTVQPGDFNVGVQRTAASAPTAGAGGTGPQPALPGVGAGTGGGPSPAMPSPASGGGQPAASRPGAPAPGGIAAQPRTAAPQAGTQPVPGAAVPPPGQPAAGAAANQEWSLRGQLQGLGFDTNGMADDQAAWNALANRLAVWNQSVQQNAQLAQYGQFYLANKERIDAAMRAGATPQQAVQAATQGIPAQGVQGGVAGVQGGQPAAALTNLFGAPEFDQEWMKFVQIDPQSGKAVVPMGYDPSIGPKVDRYRAWRADTFEKFMADPMAMLEKGIMPIVQREAQKLAQQQVGGFADQQFAQGYVQSQPWMMQRDQAGNVVLDPMSGAPLLTPAGLRFKGYVEHCQKLGINDVRQQAQMATAMVERDAALWELNQLRAGGGGNPTPAAAAGAPAAANDAAQRAAALQMNGARRIAGGGGQGTVAGAAAATTPKRPIGRHSLRNRLAGALQQAGIN